MFGQAGVVIYIYLHRSIHIKAETLHIQGCGHIDWQLAASCQLCFTSANSSSDTLLSAMCVMLMSFGEFCTQMLDK